MIGVVVAGLKVTRVEVAHVPPAPQDPPRKSGSLHTSNLTVLPPLMMSVSVAVAVHVILPPGMDGLVLTTALKTGG